MNKNKALIIASVSAFCLLTGCQSYFERNDGVSTYLGEAQAANEIKMVEDPWRRKAHNTHQHADGERISSGVSKYKAGTNGKDAPAASPINLPTGG